MTEQAFYLDCGGEAVFATHHAPAEGNGEAAVLFVPPFGWDDVATYRARREWALHLAGRGHHVLRFDLPGTGDSAGELAAPGRFETWRAAVALAARWLRETSRAPRLAAVGIRSGGYLAFDCAAQGLAQEVVLWATPPTGRRFLRELQAFGSLEASRIAAAGGPRPPAEAPGIEAGGFVIDDELAAAFRGVDLAQTALSEGARVLLIDRDGAGSNPELADALRSRGVDVEVATGSGYGAMVVPPDKSKAPREVFETVDAWLACGSGGTIPDTATGTPQAAELVAPGLCESHFTVESTDVTLRAILTRPVAAAEAPLTLVFLNAGAVRRIGPHRLWVEVARRWARRGVPSLRIDFEGIGDADGDGEVYAHVPRFYEQRLVDHVSAVLDASVERGLPGPYVLLGLCSGGFWGFQAALHDPRVAATVMVNTRILYWHDRLDVVRGLDQTRRLFTDTRAWRRLLRGDGSIARLQRRLATLSAATTSRFGRAEGTTHSVYDWQGNEIEQGFDVLRDADRNAHFVFSEGEPLRDELTRAGLLSQPDRWPNVHATMIPGLDHTLNPVWMHAHAHEAVDEAIRTELARIGDALEPVEPVRS